VVNLNILSRKEPTMTNTLSANRLLPCSVVLLSAEADGKQDLMTATALFVSEKVPLCIVSLDKNSLCHELVEASGQFILNVLSEGQVPLARKAGQTHGRDHNKFKEFNVKYEQGQKAKAPLLNDSYANLECKVITSYPLGTYTLYLAEVVAHQYRDDRKAVAWHRDTYFRLGDQVG
jgi:flavin reductase (DIM6/NTAB) family NADH-FMN oxidoreductase RutF